MADPPRRAGWKYELDPVFGCWRWTGSIDRYGYGILWGPGGPRQAHVAVYRELVGEPGVGMRLDHLCRRRDCVRPAHLEPVSESENQKRRSWRVRARGPICAIRHDPNRYAMVTETGGRLCRLCHGPERT